MPKNSSESMRFPHPVGLSALRRGLLALLCATGTAQAQLAPAPEAAASSAATATATAAPRPSCTQLTARAMSADLKASSAPSQNQDLDSQARLLDEAHKQWAAAAEACDGRARERAQKHLADNDKLRQGLAERLAAGSQCESAHRDAGALQDLAKTAFGERRWSEAASLYGKAETMWELAAELCTGSQQELAQRRRQQSEVDAHNAEVCAPLFERAREGTQKFRAAAPGLQPTERQQQSQQVETLWRQAAARCRGSAQELASNNAQALGRERGTPWTGQVEGSPGPAAAGARAPAGVSAAPTAAAATAATAAAAASTKPAAPAPATTAPSSTAAAVATAPVATARAGGGGLLSGLGSALAEAGAAVTRGAAAPAPETTTAVPAGTPQPLDVLAGDTRYKGLFVREPGQVVSGTGRVEWSNGDVYEGQLLRSQRHGQGEIRWASGQSYKGQWVQDQASGQGEIRYANGDRYVGSVVDGRAEGEGEMFYASGDSYRGQIRAGVPQGKGLYRWVSGQQYEGEWVQDKPQGRGVLRYANGNRYEGQLRAGIPHGKGRMQFVSGESYEGDYLDGQQHGQGEYRWAGGERYVGAWLKDQKSGRGVFHWANGDRWEGLFKDDQRVDSEGTLIRKDEGGGNSKP